MSENKGINPAILAGINRKDTAMSEFKRFHPLINLIYFLSVMCFCFIIMHPLVSATALVGAIVYAVMLKGAKALRFFVTALFPMMILTAVLNPLFSHEGATVLGYMPGGNPITLEAIYYGISASVVLGAVLSLFTCFNEIMTSDKLLYLFSRISPSLSLLLSMVLRFVPRFGERIKATARARESLAPNEKNTSLKAKAKNGIKILSAMTTWSLESAIDTSDSMKSRAHGMYRRSSYSIYHFDRYTIAEFMFLVLLTIYTIIGATGGVFDFQFYPEIKAPLPTAYAVSVYVAYGLLCFYPIIIEIREAIKWKLLKSRI